MELCNPLPTTSPPLWLIRSDTGDGGWSLHTKAAMKAACDAGDAPAVLHSGTAEWDEEKQEWSRPSISDFVDAYGKLNAKTEDRDEAQR